MTGPRPVVVATAEEAPSATTWHTEHLLHRLAADPRTTPSVLDWLELRSALTRPPGCTTWSPADLDDRRGVLTIRRRLGRPAASAVRGRLLRAWLHGRRDQAMVLDGGRCASIVAWLGPRSAPTIWLVHPDDPVDLAALGPDPARVLGRLDEIRVADAAAADRLVGAGAPAGRVFVGADDAALAPVGHRTGGAIEHRTGGAFEHGTGGPIGLLGPLDDDHGLDLALRLLWALDRRRPGTRATWAGGDDPVLPPRAAEELDRTGLTGRLAVEPTPADLGAWAAGIAVLVLPWRVAADLPETRAIRGAGRAVIGFDDGPGGVAFPDVEALADRVADRLAAAPERDPGPGDLLDRLLGEGP